MSLRNYKKASDYKVRKWLEEEIPDITYQQKMKIYENEMIRFAPFEFMKRRTYVKSFWCRLTIVFVPFVLIVLLIGLPFKFIISGEWGYGSKNIACLDEWITKIGF